MGKLTYKMEGFAQTNNVQELTERWNSVTEWRNLIQFRKWDPEKKVKTFYKSEGKKQMISSNAVYNLLKSITIGFKLAILVNFTSVRVNNLH